MLDSELQSSVQQPPSVADTPTTSSTFSDQPQANSSNDATNFGLPNIDSPSAHAEPTTTTNDTTPAIKKRRKKRKKPLHKSKMITGYIIYASEIRKDVIKKYPNREFGDISKLVGTEWKNLPAEVKFAYEKRAQEQNAKSKAFAAQQKLEFDRLSFAEQANQNLNSNSNTTNNNNNPLIINNNSLSCQANGSTHTLPGISQQCNGYGSHDHMCHSPASFNGDPNSVGPIGQGSSSINIVGTPIFQQQQQFQYTCANNHGPCSKQQQYIPSTPNSIQNPTVHIIQNSRRPNGSELNNRFSTPNQVNTSISNQAQFTVNGNGTNNYIVHRESTCPITINGNSNNLLSNSITASPNNSPIIQYQKNNIVYKKPTTVRLKPKDSSTQTSPIKWIKRERPKEPLKFSQKFIDYLISNYPEHQHLRSDIDVDMEPSNNPTNTN